MERSAELLFTTPARPRTPVAVAFLSFLRTLRWLLVVWLFPLSKNNCDGDRRSSRSVSSCSNALTLIYVCSIMHFSLWRVYWQWRQEHYWPNPGCSWRWSSSAVLLPKCRDLTHCDWAGVLLEIDTPMRSTPQSRCSVEPTVVVGWWSVKRNSV